MKGKREARVPGTMEKASFKKVIRPYNFYTHLTPGCHMDRKSINPCQIIYLKSKATRGQH